ncbi:MAG: hypothetical protein M3Q34_03070 [bacterium]|nr:hypothetical protein [bacterium]
MKSILVYGDSLVYGKMQKTVQRYSREKNFIGILEKELGNEFEVADEGLRARMLSGENKFFPERDGLLQFGPILGSHLPLDLVCLFLGTNDCNRGSDKSEGEIHEALGGYKHKITFWCQNLGITKIPKILLIAPPLVRGNQVILDEGISQVFDSNSEDKSKRLKDIYKNFCDKEDCLFFNAADFCVAAGNEGVHLDEENNVSLGKALADKIKEINL